MKKIILILLILVAAASAWLYFHNQQDFSYAGIPAVDCIDHTQQLKQDFTLNISIQINGKEVALPANLGHDNGNCLRSIHTDDSSGIVKVQSNYSDVYTLGQFFNVWHQAFSSKVLLGHEADEQSEDKHVIDVIVNGQEVKTYEQTPLLPGESIKVIYN